MPRKWEKVGKGTDPSLPVNLGVCGAQCEVSQGEQAEYSFGHQCINVPCLNPFPWHTPRQTLRIPDSLSSPLPLSHLLNIYRPTQAGSLSQTLPQSTQLSVPPDLISGRIFMIGIPIRRVTQRSPHLLSLISSPKPSSTPRRG